MLDRLALDVEPGTAPVGLVHPDVLARLAKEYQTSGGAESERILERFSLALHGVRMGGTWKRTNAGRLGSTESAILAHLEPVTSGHPETLHFLDLGASDGTTTREAVERFESEGKRAVSAVLADLNLWIDVTHRFLGNEYRAADGEPILRTFGSRGLRLSRGRKGMKEGSFLTRVYCFLFRPGNRPTKNPDERIWLINPRVQADPRIEAVPMNALVEQERFRGRFHAIRASNVLNIQYFDADQLARAATILHGYLKPNGLLVVSRNVGDYPHEVEKGTLWRRTPTGFKRVLAFGGGSEIQDLIDALVVPTQPAPKLLGA